MFNEIIMLYNSQDHGFKASDFHFRCDDHSYPTIAVMRSKAGKTFGGFTFDNWDS